MKRVKFIIFGAIFWAVAAFAIRLYFGGYVPAVASFLIGALLGIAWSFVCNNSSCDDEDDDKSKSKNEKNNTNNKNQWTKL